MTLKAIAKKGNKVPQQALEKLNELLDNSATDWSSVVQAALDAAGLSIFDRVESPQQQLPMNSIAKSLGHKTLESFIESSRDEGGMDFSWETWEKHIRAYKLTKELNLTSDSPDNLLDQYDKVVFKLQRNPTSSIEFTRTIESLNADVVRRERRASKDLVNSLESRIDKLVSEISQEKSRAAELNTEVKTLQSEIKSTNLSHAEALIKQETALRAEAELALQELKEASDAEKQAVIDSYEVKIQSLETKHQEEVARIKAEYDAKIETLIADHTRVIQELTDFYEGKIASLEKEIADLKETYETGNYIELSKYKELLASNEKFENSLIAAEAKLSAAMEDVESYKKEIANYELLVEENTQVLGKLNADVSKYKVKIKTLEAEFDNHAQEVSEESSKRSKRTIALKDKEIDELKARINKSSEDYVSVLKGEIDKYKGLLSTAEDKCEQAMFKHSVLMDSQAVMREELNTLQARGKRLTRIIKKKNRRLVGLETLVKNKNNQLGLIVLLGVVATTINILNIGL